jgi:molybdopterin-containing oxidoreductase family iron-sulfur binding subunit
MVIDLDRCIGCNACAAACYAENNVPIVGREGCARGREMSWLRIENYGGPPSAAAGEAAAGGRSGVQAFGVQDRPEAPNAQTPERPNASSDLPWEDGAPLEIRIRFLPMLCQQCNNAPCEYVCPVYATMHSNEGLNQQIYNRCVGTRFCSNNCPYKVRRFNWFTYDFPSPLDQQLNPDVIHRTKGIMEKCTFCIQRIRRGRIDAASAEGSIRDGQIMTACQQTCPTDAIIFGDLKDPNSRVRQLSEGPRGYGVLAELNTYPNITYLARVRAG